MSSTMKSTKVRSIPDHNLSNWMSQLPDELKRQPLSQICIPGTHDSFTYSLSKDSPVGPDEPKWIQRACKVFGRAAKTIIYRWARCQRASCSQQLQLGIRYFDIRLAKFPGCSSGLNINVDSAALRVIHGLFGEDIAQILGDMKSFLNENPGEVLILDFQHIFSFQPEDHKFLITLLIETFGLETMCPMPHHGVMYSLDEMLSNGHRVVVIYPGMAWSEKFLWPREFCPNPWPNTMKLASLQKWLDHGIRGRDRNGLFVSQGILTPTVGTVALHPFSSLEKSVCVQCNKFLSTWLESKQVHQYNPNIVMCDFAESTSIPKQIVSLNRR